MTPASGVHDVRLGMQTKPNQSKEHEGVGERGLVEREEQVELSVVRRGVWAYVEAAAVRRPVLHGKCDARASNMLAVDDCVVAPSPEIGPQDLETRSDEQDVVGLSRTVGPTVDGVVGYRRVQPE